MNILWMPTAQRRFVEVADDLLREAGPASAAKWVETVNRRVALLENNPLIGRQVPEVRRPEILELVVLRHRVVYRADLSANRCAILSIRHERQKTTRANFNAWHPARSD